MASSITDNILTLGGIDLVGTTDTLTLSGTNPTLAGVHTLNVTSSLQVNGATVATTSYVDDLVQGRSWLAPVLVASTATVDIDNDLQDGSTLDGVGLASNDRVLLKNQTSALQNGVYLVVASGSAARALDMDDGAHAATNAVFVQAGTYADKAFVCTNNTGSDVVGTNNLVFVQFGGDAAVADLSITTSKLADNAVTSAKIADHAIDTLQLADNAVETAQLGDQAVNTAQLADDAVTTAKIINNAVTNDKIEDATITGAKIASSTIDGSNISHETITGDELGNIQSATITAYNIADSTITSSKIDVQTVTGGVGGNIALATITTENIGTGAVGTTNLADGAVSTDKIDTGAVTGGASGHIASQTITADNIAANTITFAEIDVQTVTGGVGGNIALATITADNIGTGAVQTTNLADDAVTNDKISAGAVTGGASGHIASQTITADNIATNTITFAEIGIETVTGGTGGNIALATIATENLQDSCVTMDKLANNSIDYSKFDVGAVNNDALGAQCVTADKIFNNTITAAQIEAGTITATEIADTTITASKLVANTITASQIAAGTITATQIANTTITGGKLVANTITASQIAAGTITATELASSAVTGAKLNSNVVGVNMVYNTSTNRLDSIRRVFDPVRCVSTTNINPNNALENGDVLDGVTLATNDRVLLTGQSAAAANGIYIVQASGPALRASDMAASRSDQLSVHSTVFVTSGTVNANTTWRVSSTSGATPSAIAVGTESSVWSRAEAPVLTASIVPGTFTAGTYSLAGSTISDLGSVTTGNITVGSGKTLNVSAATAFTTSAAQKKAIIEGANDNVSFGSFTVTAQTFATVSDSRHKTNIDTIKPEDGMELVRSIRGVKYNMKTNNVASAGVIAQEVQEKAPELVVADASGMLTMNYDGLNGYLVPAIQLLYDKLAELTEEVDKLKRKRSLDQSDQSDQADQIQPAKLAKLASPGK